MMKKYKGKKWIVAVSGGPDSMALLDMCVQSGIDVEVAHVNYHKRDTADRDEKCVLDYCLGNNIPFHKLEPVKKDHSNFQAWAREVRYQFFNDCANKVAAQGVMVAHHQDDHIETYLIQKSRKSIPSNYGIGDEVIVKGLKVVRPLLSLSKNDCIQYCNKHGVLFYTDESNLTDAYTRNKIRHAIVEKMDKEKREEILGEIQVLNDEKKEVIEKCKELIQDNKIHLIDYRKLSFDTRLELLRLWLRKNSLVEHNKSKEYFIQLDEMMKSNKNYEIEMESCVLSKSYEICEVVGKEDKSYSFVLQSISEFETEYFKITYEGKTIEGVTVSQDDFPLTIRNARASDTIQLRIGKKKVGRWFIDRKIPMKERKTWPIIVNCRNEVIFVAGIGCDMAHFTIKPNCFMVKY